MRPEEERSPHEQSPEVWPPTHSADPHHLAEHLVSQWESGLSMPASRAPGDVTLSSSSWAVLVLTNDVRQRMVADLEAALLAMRSRADQA